MGSWVHYLDEDFHHDPTLTGHPLKSSPQAHRLTSQTCTCNNDLIKSARQPQANDTSYITFKAHILIHANGANCILDTYPIRYYQDFKQSSNASAEWKLNTDIGRLAFFSYKCGMKTLINSTRDILRLALPPTRACGRTGASKGLDWNSKHIYD